MANDINSDITCITVHGHKIPIHANQDKGIKSKTKVVSIKTDNNLHQNIKMNNQAILDSMDAIRSKQQDLHNEIPRERWITGKDKEFNSKMMELKR